MYTYLCMYVCMYTYVRTYVRTCMYVHVHVCMYIRMYVCTYVCMYVCLSVCLYVCTYVHTYIHTYIHTYQLADLSDFWKLLGEKTSGGEKLLKCAIPCPGRQWTTLQNLAPLALSWAEKSVTVQTNRKNKYVSRDWPTSKHADLRPHAVQYSTNGTSLAWRLRWVFTPWTLSRRWLANPSDFGLLGEQFPRMGNSLPRTSMNHCAKFDAAGCILGGKILNCTNTQNYKQTVANISTPCLSACVDKKL